MLNKKYFPFLLNAMVCAILLVASDIILFFYNVPTLVICVIDGFILYLTPKFIAQYVISNNPSYNIQASIEGPETYGVRQYFTLDEADITMVLNHHFKRTVIFWGLCTGGLFLVIGLCNFLICMISPETFVNVIDSVFSGVDWNNESVESLMFHPFLIGIALSLLAISIISYAIVAHVNSKKLFKNKMINGKFYLI